MSIYSDAEITEREALHLARREREAREEAERRLRAKAREAEWQARRERETRRNRRIKAVADRVMPVVLLVLLVGGCWGAWAGWHAYTEHRQAQSAAEQRYQEGVRHFEDCHTYSDIRGGLYERIEEFRSGDGYFDPADASTIAGIRQEIKGWEQRSSEEGCP
jgi:hypothetical protein